MSDAIERPRGFHLYINPGDASAMQVARILDTLTAMHVAAGANGLHFAITETGSIHVTPRRAVGTEELDDQQD